MSPSEYDPSEKSGHCVQFPQDTRVVQVLGQAPRGTGLSKPPGLRGSGGLQCPKKDSHSLPVNFSIALMAD